MKPLIGKFLYGSLFVLILPFCLVEWAEATDNIIRIPVPDIPAAGWLLLVIGVVLMIMGMRALMVYGKGLPMNAYPPGIFVSTGIYAVTAHPIYVGAAMTSFGISILFQSSSGFWMISPLFCAAMMAYVSGFENERIKSTKGYFEYRPVLSAPEKSETPNTTIDKLNVILLVFLPWLIMYELFIFIGIPKDARMTNLVFEKNLPIIEFSEIFYILPYILVVCIPFVLKTKSHIRGFMHDAWWAMAAGFILYCCFPFVVQQREFTPTNFLGRMIYRERNYDAVSAALPAFHVIWAFFIYKYYSLRFGSKIFWLLLAILISLSCILNGSHSVPDVFAGWLVFYMVDKRLAIWSWIRQWTEKISDSWTEWHWGEVRIINHGFYVGAAGFTGVLIVGSCLGKSFSFAGFLIGLSAIVGAAVWAQFVEGSPRLLRPYGYYGSVIGILLTSSAFSLIYHFDFLYILGSFALAAPWIQLLGRLRCLVQGCCHGKPCSPKLGIRFINPHSRVLKIAGLKGIYIHPTQLYSIFCNFLTGLFLIRLYGLQMSVAFITGIYFILNGLARFVEEAFRGEPQTVYWNGLRLYQWIAILSILAGAFITSIPSPITLNFAFNSNAVLYAVVFAFIATLCYGVDFPNSNKRFARLTG